MPLMLASFFAFTIPYIGKISIDRIINQDTVRLSTIRSADCILVIENGEIQEQGNHAELLQLRVTYHDLYQTPFI